MADEDRESHSSSWAQHQAVGRMVPAILTGVVAAIAAWRYEFTGFDIYAVGITVYAISMAGPKASLPMVPLGLMLGFPRLAALGGVGFIGYLATLLGEEAMRRPAPDGDQ